MNSGTQAVVASLTPFAFPGLSEHNYNKLKNHLNPYMPHIEKACMYVRTITAKKTSKREPRQHRRSRISRQWRLSHVLPPSRGVVCRLLRGDMSNNMVHWTSARCKDNLTFCSVPNVTGVQSLASMPPVTGT